MEDKKKLKEARNDFTLHTALIMREGKSKPDALVIAYAEGKAGLNVRLTGTADQGSRK